ncbi:RNAse P Rpr2/Rpp21/SNM1 subunit domain-containing protein [Cordyceps javanica]|uniref:RNAse P Rpr2/Rpp21/SNM1 subunit domain-containing protein n=1 Tax=Cordyceps javanica TaxID=43265 RepID=A0A545VTD4_9HYPO|nr:RNAse P Rpr2/Rpp21/SNM1 subunit domain-containing protein [Cordyceps javanica]TQW04966.1 RNAse P Rpr2/Rpp21/SNM1 subunit domain-containing protein [Cordyceps javanica]
MARAKAPPGVQNRHIYTRASYLYQAAAFLATASLQPLSRNAPDGDGAKGLAGTGSAEAPSLTQPARDDDDDDDAALPSQTQAARTTADQQPQNQEQPQKQQKSQEQQEQQQQEQQQQEQQQCTALRNMSRSLLADMRAVTLKVMIRQRPEMKRTVCRYCDALLVEGRTCDAVVENASRGGRKPWADVLAVRCRTCGGVKRFAVGEPRRRHLRSRSLRVVGEDAVAGATAAAQTSQREAAGMRASES